MITDEACSETARPAPPLGVFFLYRAIGAGSVFLVLRESNVKTLAITLAIVNDYGVVLAGLESILAPFSERVQVVELDANMPVSVDVDVVLYDTFARPEPNLGELQILVANPHARRVVVFSWSFDADLVQLALSLGADGYISKTSTAEELVVALEAVVSGETVISPKPGRPPKNSLLDWPGRTKDLTSREAEVLALITQGKSNADISALLHLSVNTIKGNIRSAYQKIGARNRVEAVLWGTSHGMLPDQQRIINWSDQCSGHERTTGTG